MADRSFLSRVIDPVEYPRHAPGPVAGAPSSKRTLWILATVVVLAVIIVAVVVTLFVVNIVEPITAQLEREQPYAKRGFSDVSVQHLVVRDASSGTIIRDCWNQPE